MATKIRAKRESGLTAVRLKRDPPVIGLRATKAAMYEYGAVTKVPIAKKLLKVTENSHHLYLEHRIAGVSYKKKNGRHRCTEEGTQNKS